MLAINVACSRCKAVQQFEHFPTGGQSLLCCQCGAPLNSCTGWIGPVAAARRLPAEQPDGRRAWQPMDRVRVLAALAVGLPALLLSGIAFTAFFLRADDSSALELPDMVNPPLVVVAESRPGPALPAAPAPLPAATQASRSVPIQVDPPAAPTPQPAVPALPEPQAKRRDPKPPVPAPAPAKRLSPEQKRINEAIDRGVKFLKISQSNAGRWDKGASPVGYAALPGLTLLECGLPADSPAVQRAAKFVRGRAAKLTATYELSLAILFLDRLGDPRDRDLMQTLAMRLIAGQNAAGGWTYHCPVLAKADHQRLLAFLERQQTHLLLAQDKAVEPLSGSRMRTGVPGARPEASLVQPLDPGDMPSPENKQKSSKNSAKSDPLPAHLRGLPVVRMKEEAPTPGGRIKGKGMGFAGGVSGDNSNTQFAMLALWVARRRGVPMERTLALIKRRFQTTQNADGGWGYHTEGPAAFSKPSMTCVGLLGLAIGHGFAQEMALKGSQDAPVPPRGEQNPAIQRGLQKLGAYLDVPERARLVDSTIDLYTLWSVQRVGVLYDLKTIGNKDWYPWSARLLVANQNANGSWSGRGYHGSTPTIDTCLALLILKRTNLVPDLSDSLRLLGISESNGGSRILEGQ